MGGGEKISDRTRQHLNATTIRRMSHRAGPSAAAAAQRARTVHGAPFTNRSGGRSTEEPFCLRMSGGGGGGAREPNNRNWELELGQSLRAGGKLPLGAVVNKKKLVPQGLPNLENDTTARARDIGKGRNVSLGPQVIPPPPLPATRPLSPKTG